MRKLEDPPKFLTNLDLVSLIGAESEDDLSPLERSLAPYVSSMRAGADTLGEDLASLWRALIDCLTRQEIGRSCRLSLPARQLALDKLRSGADLGALLQHAARLELVESFLFRPLLEELNALRWGWSTSQALQKQQKLLNEATLAGVSRLLGRRVSELEFLRAPLDSLWESWAQALLVSPALGQLQLCGHWAESWVSSLECSFHDWRVLFESLQMALTAHLEPGQAFGLNAQLATLSRAIPRFEFVALLARTPQGSPAADFLRLCRAELLYSCAWDWESSPSLAQVLLAERPWLVLNAFREQSKLVLEHFRPLCERSWLDWLDHWFSRMEKALAWREARHESAKPWTATVRLATTNLSEALEYFRKTSGNDTELQGVFEAATEAMMLSNNPAQARSLFRAWFMGLHAVRQSQGLWLQARAVVKSLRTQLQAQREFPVKAFIEEGLGLTELIPGLVESAQNLRLAGAPQETICAAGVQAALSQSGDRLRSWVITQLRNDGADAFDQMLLSTEQSARLLALTENSELWQRGRLASNLWMQHHLYASQAAQQVYRLLDDYAQQTGSEGPEKCARDLGALLRRTSWVLLAEAEAGESLLDWWREFVASYLFHRHARLMPTTLEALLEVLQKGLAAGQLELAESLLRPLFEEPGQPAEAEAGDVFRAEFHPLPLATRSMARQGPALEAGWTDALAYAQRFATIEEPMQRHLDSAQKLLEEGWSDYHWRGSLSPSFCKSWRRWCELRADSSLVFERWMVGLMTRLEDLAAPANLARLDYFQSVQEFCRQASAGQELLACAAELAREVVADLHQHHLSGLQRSNTKPQPQKCTRDVRMWLEHLGQCLASHPQPLCGLEFRRYLVDCVAPHIQYGLEAWRPIWRYLANPSEKLSVSDNLRRVLQFWASQMLHSGPALLEVGAISRRYAATADPVFSPNPREENQWRQLVGSLLALQVGASQDAHAALKAVVAALPLCKERDFPGKMEAVSALFWGDQGSPYLGVLRCVSHVPEATAETSEVSTWLELARSGERSSNHWGMPAWLRHLPADAVTWSEEHRRDLSVRSGLVGLNWLPELSSLPPQPEVSGTYSLDTCRRDMGWLHRRLVVEAIAGQGSPGSLDWFGWEVAPYAPSVSPEEHLLALRSLMSAYQRGDSPLGPQALALWARLLPRLRSEQVQGHQGAQLRGYASGGEAFFLLTTPKVGVRKVALAEFSESARDYSQRFAGKEPLTTVQVDELLALLQEEMASFEELSMASSRLAVAWSGHSQLDVRERFLIGLLYTVGDRPKLQWLERLRLLDYVQACVELTRQVRLGLELSSKAGALAQNVARRLHTEQSELLAQDGSPTSEAKCARDLSHVFHCWADCLNTGPRPLALLNLMRYLVDQVSPYIVYGERVWKSVWSLVEEEAANLLSAEGHRELSWWTPRLTQSCASLREAGTIARALQERCETPGRDLPGDSWRAALCSCLALRLLQDANLPWLPAVRRVVASSFSLGPSDQRTQRLQDQWSWLRDSFIEFDLRTLETEIQQLGRGWEIQQSLLEIEQQKEALLERLLERVPGARSIPGDQLSSALLGLVRSQWAGEPSSRWGVPACIRLLPDAAALAVVALGPEQNDKLQAAMVNLLGRFGTVPQIGQELAKLVDLASRLGELEKAWDRSLKLDPKVFSETCQRDLNWVARRICLEAWIGGRPSADGSLSWYRWEVVPYAGETRARDFLKGIQAVAQAVESETRFTQAMKRVADEFRRSIEQRLEGADPKKSVWQSISAPVLDHSLRAQKPEKRTWWGRLTESFEGLVGGRKED